MATGLEPRHSGGAGLDTGEAALDARTRALGPLPSLPPDATNAWADDPSAAWFGRYLFQDVRLSGTGTRVLHLS